MTDYSDNTPTLEWDESVDNQVFIVDLSFSREILELWKEKAKGNIQLLDHHKSAQEKLGDLEYCHFDMTKCGARLAWEYCFPDKEAHWLVDYTEDLDLWKWQLPYSKEIVAALQKYKFDFSVWDGLYYTKKQALFYEGQHIIKYNRDLINYHMTKVEMVNFKGYTNVPIVYCDIKDIYSELGNLMVNTFSAPFSVTWKVNGGKKLYSLRSTNDSLDVSEVAKKFGGGGHRNAAGFSEDY